VLTPRDVEIASMLAAELEGLLKAHAFLRVERPPGLWAPQAELEPVIRLLGPDEAWHPEEDPEEAS
jgi:hypothetical protein